MRLTWPAALRRRIAWALLVSVALHVLVVGALFDLFKLTSKLHQRRGDTAVFVELQRPEEKAPRGSMTPPAAPAPRTPQPAAAAPRVAAVRPSPARPAEPSPPAAPQPPRPQAPPRSLAPPAERPLAPARAAPPPQPVDPEGAPQQVAKATEARQPAPTPEQPTTSSPTRPPDEPAAPGRSGDARVAKAPPPDLRAFRRGLGATSAPGGFGGGRGGITGEPMTLDSKDPRFAEYLARVKEKIIANWAYPCVKDPASRECHLKSAHLVVEFGILRNGQLQFVELRQPSGAGLDIYDDYALNAIRLASPFPEIPRDIMLTRPGSTGIPIVGTFTYTFETTLRNILR